MVGNEGLGYKSDHVYPVLNFLTIILRAVGHLIMLSKRIPFFPFKTDVISNQYAWQDAGEKISYDSI